MTADGVIGRRGSLPWRLSADLQRFKSITMGHPIVMGRKTHESIGRALPGRRNIVVSRNASSISPDCEHATSFENALEVAGDAQEVMIVGGALLYEAALPGAGRLFVTEVNATVDGDTFFPEWERSHWHEVAREFFRADDRNEYDYSFVVYERNLRA